MILVILAESSATGKSELDDDGDNLAGSRDVNLTLLQELISTFCTCFACWEGSETVVELHAQVWPQPFINLCAIAVVLQRLHR